MALTRRGLFAAGAAIVGADALAAARMPEGIPGEYSFIPVPQNIRDEIAKTLARFRAWKGKDETVVFPVLTDVHDETKPVVHVPEKWLDFWEQKLHVLYAKYAAQRFGADFVADLGDIGMDRCQGGKAAPWAEHMKPRLELHYRLYDGLDVPVLFSCGNHDLGHSQRHITTKEWATYFNIPQRRNRKGATELGPTGDYGYLDLAAKRTRIVFLNTSVDSVGGEAISKEELAWIGPAVESTPQGWRLVVLSHICLEPHLGYWTLPGDNGVHDGNGFPEMRAILEKFAAARKVPVIAIAGHSHCDFELEQNGVIYAISQCLGTTPFQAIPANGRYQVVDRGHQTIFDFVALKPANGDCRMFRVGAGGEAADRDLATNADRGSVAAAFAGGTLRLTVPGVMGSRSFTVSADEARRKNLTAETRDGIRFVYIDNAGGELTQEQFDFFNREKGSLTPVALVLSVPLYMPGLTVEEAPCGHPRWKMPPDHPEIRKRVGWLGGGHSYTTFYFRWNVLHAPRLVGVFSAYADRSFAASCDGVFQASAPAKSGLNVVING